jgi:hypothetical protein
MNTTLVARSQEAEKYVLFAKLDNAKILYNLAKSVNFKEVLISFHFINIQLLFKRCIL